MTTTHPTTAVPSAFLWIRRVLTAAMLACFASGGWLLLRPVLTPSESRAAALLGELRDGFLAGQVAADDLGLPP